ncbi:MAG: ABC transporter substrate-binding protein [Ilumatobacteraceae bacterium]
MTDKKIIWVPNNSVTRRQLLVGGTAAAAAAATLAACGGDDTTSAPTTTEAATPPSITAAPDTTAPTGGITKGGILRMGTLGGSNDLLDGQHIVSKADIARIVTGWEGLLNFDPAYNIVNDDSIAEEVEAKAADNYVVRLKEGILFADGKPVTADDVIYSFTRMLDPDNAVFGGAALRPILDPTGLVKVDDRTVEITLKQPVATFPEGLCAYTCNIVPTGYERFAGDPTNQIGTGPFMLQEFEVGVQSIHVRNPNYWQPDKPYFDEVHIIDFADADAMVNALLADQIDCCADIPATAVETLNGGGMSVLNAAGGGWTPIFMAVDIEPFTDNKVRQAMRLIPDRQGVIDQVAGGYGTIANDLFAPLDACYIGDELPQRDQDLEQAAALLAEAGNPELPALLAPNDTAGLPELIQAFAAMAAEGGITIDAQVVDGGIYWGDEYLKRPFGTDFWGTRNFLAQCAAGELPSAPYPDTHWPPAGSTFIDDYNAAVAETDLEKRKVITDKMQNELYETGGLIIAFFGNQIDGFNPRVQGLVERPNTLNLDHYGRGYKNLYFSE